MATGRNAQPGVGESQGENDMTYRERRKAALKRASPKAIRLGQLIDGRDYGGSSFVYRLIGEMMLGLKSPEHGRPKWPKDAHGEITLDGWRWVLFVQPNHGHHPAGHRLHVVCPDCSGIIPVGRFHQHIGTNACMKAAERAKRPMTDMEATVFGDSVPR